MPINVSIPQDGVPPSKPDIRANFLAINNKIARLPESYTSAPAGTLVVTSDASDGIQTAAEGTEPVHVAGRQIGHYKPAVVAIANNTSITTQNHEGCLLRMRNSGGVILQLEKNASVSLGVQDLFSCTIYRPSSSGSVQISSSSLTNDHPQGHTKVSAGHMATLFVDGETNRFLLEGGTEA